MQIVMEFTEGDGCTYSCTHTTPIVYESCEAAIVDFEAAVKAAQTADEPRFDIFGQIFWVYTFFEEGVFYSPEFMTVEEWFARGAR